MEETLLEFQRKTEAYRTMNAELEILGVKLKHYRVDAAMEIAEEYLSNDKLNTIGIVTMQMLMQASKEPTWKQYIEDLDLTVIGETEVLEAAGIDPETPSAILAKRADDRDRERGFRGPKPAGRFGSGRAAGGRDDREEFRARPRDEMDLNLNDEM